MSQFWRVGFLSIVLFSGIDLCMASYGLDRGSEPTWRAEVTASTSLNQSQNFGQEQPSFLGFRWQGSIPGNIGLSGSLDGSLVLSALKPTSLTFARIRQWKIKAQSRRAKLSVGRLFIAWGLPMGYLDGAVFESKVLGPLGLRAMVGQPVIRGPMGRGLSLGGGITFRGRMGTGVLYGDLGALRTGGSTWINTGQVTERVAFIRKEVVGGSIAYSTYSTSLSSIIQYDTLYLRWSEIRTAAAYRLRNRTAFRAEHRYRSNSFPADSLLITFAGAGRTWNEFVLGTDIPVGPTVFWIDGGITPSRRGYWSSVGLRSGPRAWFSKSRGLESRSFLSQWSLTGRRESGANGESFRVLSRLGFHPGRHLKLRLGGGAGRLRFSDRPVATGINGWDAWVQIARSLGPGEANVSMEIQAWREGKPDRRVQAALSLAFGPGAQPWKKPK